MEPLRVNARLVLPAGELDVSFARAGGPGGQNVNKVESKVVLRFSVAESRTLGDVRRARLLERLVRRAQEFLPSLPSVTALRAWTGFRPTTPDHRPLIGAWPGRNGLWLACGHEGLGVTTALGTADLLAAQLLGLPLPFDAQPYAPARFAAQVSHAA